MAVAAFLPRRLDASAPPYVVSNKSFVPPPVPDFYTCPPAAVLPPAGFLYPPPVLVAPPAPGFAANSPAFWGFPLGPTMGMQGSYAPQPSWSPQGSCVGMPGSYLHPARTPPQGTCVGMQASSQHPGWAPLTPMAPPPAAAVMQCAPPPQQPDTKANARGGRHRTSRSSVRGVPAPRARPPPRLRLRLDVPPRMQPAAAGRVAPPPSANSGGEVAGAGKGELQANEPSPRSVLVQTSPPITPSALPTSFPYPELGPPSPPASEPVSVPAAGSQAVAPPPRRRGERGGAGLRRQATGGTVRRSVPKPRCIFDASSGCTSLMIRNIPNDFRRTRLMHIIDQHCSIENENIESGDVKSEYDFLYLPMDFRTGANKGYAFVNLTTPEAARRLRDHLHRHRWKVNGSGKTCEVDQAYRKGLDELVKKLSDSRFDCGDEEFLPVWFEPPRDGTRTPLPHLVGRMLRCS
nr:unnamed protein product [Digitaria exilis]